MSPLVGLRFPRSFVLLLIMVIVGSLMSTLLLQVYAAVQSMFGPIENGVESQLY